MIGHRVTLCGLSSQGWSGRRGRIIGKRQDSRFLVLLDDGREAYVKPNNVTLIQAADAPPAVLAESQGDRDRSLEDETSWGPGSRARSTTPPKTPAAARASQNGRFGDPSHAGTIPRSATPGHAPPLFEERAGGSKIPAHILRELASRYRNAPIIALQDRQRNCWLLDPAQKLTIGRSTQCNVVVKENVASVSRNHCFLSGSTSDDMFYLTDTSGAGTLVNGEKCKSTSVLVRAGDLIHLGSASSRAAFVLQDFSWSQSHKPIVDLAKLEANLADKLGDIRFQPHEPPAPATKASLRKEKEVRPSK